MRNANIGNPESADILRELVPQITYKPGWTFELHDINRGQGCEGLTLSIRAQVRNSHDPDEIIGIDHSMPVLPAAYDRDSWVRWIMEQIMLVEQHETMEFFRIAGVAPYFPEHAPGKNPYAIKIIKTHDEAYAPALPWTGEPLRDDLFH